MTEPPDRCPHCGTSLTGQEIPAEHREHFGGDTHFSLAIGLYSRAADGTTHWQCPECRAEWRRA